MTKKTAENLQKYLLNFLIYTFSLEWFRLISWSQKPHTTKKTISRKHNKQEALFELLKYLAQFSCCQFA